MRPLALLAITLALVLGSGCSKRAPETKGQSTVTRLPDVLSYAETPVGATDSLVNAIGPTLAPWIVLWRHAYSGFQPDSLIRLVWSPPPAGPARPLREVYPPSQEHASAFRVLSARSPDGRYDLIFDGYQCIEEKDGRIEIGGEPESAPFLLDLKRKTAKQFDFLGGAHWGAWASPTRFVLTGIEYDDKNMGVRGVVQVHSLRDSTVTIYVTRPLHSSRSDVYRSAWESWVATRYHDTKRVASRS